jgi:hypothetical protein
MLIRDRAGSIRLEELAAAAGDPAFSEDFERSSAPKGQECPAGERGVQ